MLQPDIVGVLCDRCFRVFQAPPGEKIRCPSCGKLNESPQALDPTRQEGVAPMIRLKCPVCRSLYNVGPEKAGRRTKCVKCGELLRVPGEVVAVTEEKLPPCSRPEGSLEPTPVKPIP